LWQINPRGYLENFPCRACVRQAWRNVNGGLIGVDASLLTFGVAIYTWWDALLGLCIVG
jgi:hypothetical protein